MNHLEVIYREPFSLGSPKVFRFPVGVTVEQMVDGLPLPETFKSNGVARINDHDVPRALWGAVRPKATTGDLVPVTMTFHAPVRGGGGDNGGGGGGKDILQTVAALAIVVAASFVSGGGLAPALGTAFSAGTIGATALAAGVSLAGSLLLSAFTPSPVLPRAGKSKEGDQLTPASLTGNVLSANGPIPRVIGTRNIYPPLGAEPYVYNDSQNEFVEAFYILAGPHDLSNIKIDGTDIDNMSDVEYETREGWDTDTPITLITQQAKTDAANFEMSHFVVTPDDEGVVNSDFPAKATADNKPVFHTFVSGDSPDRVTFDLFLPEGLNKRGDTTNDVRVPFRLMFGPVGGSTYIAPDLHYVASTLSQRRLTIEFVWGSPPGVLTDQQTAGWVDALHFAVGNVDVTAGSETPSWQAESYFNNPDTTRNKAFNVDLNNDKATIYLDPAIYPKGQYEFHIKRGNTIIDQNYVASTGLYNGSALDFFALDANALHVTRRFMADSVYIRQFVSVWDEHPVGRAGFAIIAVRARNRKIEKLSVEASGYVQDWTGSAWTNWAITSNPAPHYRDVLTGNLNYDALPTTLVDDTGLVDWRTNCATNGYTCDMIVEGSTAGEVLTKIAACGYARPYQSEIWGVIQDKDRSADSPVQVFSPRNSRGFKFKKAFARLPDGVRANYIADSYDNRQEQLIVYRNAAVEPDFRKLEQLSYVGITDPAKVKARAQFDMDQLIHRSTFYEMEVPIESIRCRRGDLIGVQHDILYTQSGFGRIVSVSLDVGGDVDGITLDSEVTITSEDDMHTLTDMHSVSNMHLIGTNTGIAIRLTDGTVELYQPSNADGVTTDLTFSPSIPYATVAAGPFDSGAVPEIDTGCLVVVGLVGREYERFLVSRIDPQGDMTATMTMVDEAPEIWS